MTVLNRCLFLLLFLGVLACGSEAPAPADETPSALLIGSWNLVSRRIVTTISSSPTPISDFTNAGQGIKAVFTATTMTYSSPGTGSPPSNYTLSGMTLRFSGPYVVAGDSAEVLELTRRRLVLHRRQEDGTGQRQAVTDTFSR